MKKKYFVNNVFNSVFTKYDLMNDILSLGKHRLWKRDLINWMAPKENTKLIDVASGTGDISHLYLKNVFSKGKVFCVDNNKNMISAGKKKLGKFNNIHWFLSDAENLPFEDNYFDYYSISFGIRNTSSVDLTLRESYRVLKPGGHFLCLEFSKIENEVLKNIYSVYSKIIPKIGKLVIRDSFPYEYLVKSINDFCTQDELLLKIDKNNFKLTKYKNLSGGIAAIHSGWKI